MRHDHSPGAIGMLRYVLILSISAIAAIGPAEAKKLRWTTGAPSKPTAPAASVKPGERRAGTVVFINTGAGGGAVAAQARQGEGEARGAQRAAYSALPTGASAAPAADPDARKLPVLGGEAGDVRLAKGFTTLN
jgi:hypothetical protein